MGKWHDVKRKFQEKMIWMQLEFPPELGSGVRRGGKFGNPSSALNQTFSIWGGRPPVLGLGDSFRLCSLVISGEGGAAAGRMANISFVGSNQWGGQTKREFKVGNGISAQLQAGSFETISCSIVPDSAGNVLEAGQFVYFSWITDVVNRSPLYNYQSVLANTNYNLPEGTEYITVPAACNITFTDSVLGTFVVPALAGQKVQCPFGTFQVNIATTVVYELRGV